MLLNLRNWHHVWGPLTWTPGLAAIHIQTEVPTSPSRRGTETDYQWDILRLEVVRLWLFDVVMDARPCSPDTAGHGPPGHRKMMLVAETMGASSGGK